jgi:protein-histidine N-methyltransferase
LAVARREIFDIRTQLMAEDSAGHDNEKLIAGIEKGDITPNFYEGGFKTWECALDLAKLSLNEDILNESPDSPADIHIVEVCNHPSCGHHLPRNKKANMNKQLGAGTAVPSLTLFARLLGQAQPGQSQRKTLFTFADYNSDVLRLVTLPNLLLTWHNSRSQMAVSAGSTAPDQDEELDITPELVQEFKDDLAQRGILVDFVSGAWSPEFVDLVFSSGDGARKTLVLASETIYSPASLAAFSETLLALLRRSNTASVKSRALVAAKKVYFGVGGGVDEFLAVLGNVCANELDVQQKLNVQSEGVGRVVLEVVPSTAS